ncbi:MAG: 50S ribosomal protein L19, partial [Ruminococcaceae bacterium]|nr:50S ribosomal protein L19 [Oscillospiraceae bacterium]
MADLIQTLTEKYMKASLPEMNVGDTVRVTVRVKEGNRERTQ